MDDMDASDSEKDQDPDEVEFEEEEEPSPPPVVAPPSSKKKKKKATKSKRKSKKSSSKQSKMAKTSHSFSSAHLAGDADMESLDGEAGERGGKKKEMPKPTMHILMHHAFPFKNPEYLHKRRAIEEDKSPFRLLKHIISQEKAEWGDVPSHPSYWTIRAPPRLKPAKRYSDISGLEARYTDPETRLHYADAEEFEVCRSLTRDLVQSYLRLRGFVDIIG